MSEGQPDKLFRGDNRDKDLQHPNRMRMQRIIVGGLAVIGVGLLAGYMTVIRRNYSVGSVNFGASISCPADAFPQINIEQPVQTNPVTNYYTPTRIDISCYSSQDKKTERPDAVHVLKHPLAARTAIGQDARCAEPVIETSDSELAIQFGAVRFSHQTLLANTATATIVTFTGSAGINSCNILSAPHTAQK
jgi:hypothetical protein